MPANHRKAGEDAKVVARRVQVAALLLEGLSLSEIATRTGVSKSQAYRDVDAVRQDWRGEARTSIHQHIESHLGELAALKDAIRPKALSITGEKQLEAIDRMVKLLEREAKMLGLDQPAKSEVAVDLSKLSPEKLAEALNCLGTDQILAALAALDSGEGAGEAGGGSN